MLAVESCPNIKPGRGRVVTGIFSHFNGFVRQLWFDDAPAPVEPTDVHPFYSECRHDWVVADELRQGEYVRTAGGTARLTRKQNRPGIHRVYNLEVERENVYYAGQQRLLVHNACPTKVLDDIITHTQFRNTLSGITSGATREARRKSTIYKKKGAYSNAEADFNRLIGDANVTTAQNGTKHATLSDGTTVALRRGGCDTSNATIYIDNVPELGGSHTKIRYD